MKRRLLSTLLCLSMAATALAGCGSEPAPAESQPAAADPAVSEEAPAASSEAASSEAAADTGEHEPVELTLWVTSRNTDDFSNAMKEKFLEEHPWITLNEVVKEGDPGNEFYQGVASGTAPDLVNCSFTMMESYMSAGILEPLNAYVEDWDEWGSFTQEYVDMFTKDGTVYCVPNSVAPMLFGYINGALKKPD